MKSIVARLVPKPTEFKNMTTPQLVKCLVAYTVILAGLCAFALIVSPQIVGWGAVIVVSLEYLPKIIREIKRK
jgi:hypothetical protein